MTATVETISKKIDSVQTTELPTANTTGDFFLQKWISQKKYA